MASFNRRNLVTRTASAPPEQIYDDVHEIKQLHSVPPPVAAKPKSPIFSNRVKRTASAPISKSEEIYDDVIEVKQSAQIAPPPVAARPKSPISPNLVTRTASPLIVKHTYESEEIYDDVIEVKQSAQIAPPPVAAKPKSPISPNLAVTRTASPPIVNYDYDYESEEIYDDVIEVKQSAQIAPPPVAARPKSPNIEPTDTPIYGNVVITKENTTRRLPPPVVPKRVSSIPPTERRNTLPATTKSEQKASPVTERRNTLPVAKNQQPSPAADTVRNNPSNVAALAKEISTKLQSPPSPVANRPNLQMSPVTARRNSTLYNNTPSTVTKPLQRAPSPVVVAQQASPAIQRRNIPSHHDDIDAVSTRVGDQLHDDTASRQAVSSPSHNFAPEQLTLTKESNTEYYGTDLHDGEHRETKLLHSHDPQGYEYVVMHERTSHDGAVDMVWPTQKFSSMSRQPQIIDREANKTYLQSLSRSDVLQLLDKMNLSQHKASFQEEQVDGTTLAVLSENDLKELGVMKGVQIKRLLKLIEGEVSAKDFLETNYY